MSSSKSSWADLHPKKQKRINKQEIEKRAAELGQPDADALWQACPGCAQPIERTGGCNFIRCRACKTGWCCVCVRIKGSGTNQCNEEKHKSH